MKIAFYLTESRNYRDGVTHYVYELLKRLPENDSCDYVGEAFLGYRDTKEDVEKYFSSFSDNLKLHLKNTILPYGILRRLHYFKLPFSYENLMGNKADIHVFFHNYILKCKMKGKKAVVVHDLSPLYDESLTKREKEKIFKRYEYTIEHADLIFTDSNFSKQEIIKYFQQAEEKVCLNYCGIDYERFTRKYLQAKADNVKKKYNLDKSYILFVGQARSNKNLVRLITGYSRLPQSLKENYRLVLANHTKELAELVIKLKEESNIQLLNGIDEDDLAIVYQQSSAVALVSTSEGFGIPIIEAMASGIPVVTSKISCMPEVSGGNAVLVDPYSVDSITDGLQSILTNSLLRNSLINAGREHARQFTWDKSACQFYAQLKLLSEMD